jgi:hypothetical protein
VPSSVALVLTPVLRTGDSVLLVPALQAARLARDGDYRALPAGEALWLLQAMDGRHASDELRPFVRAAWAGLLPVRELSDAALRELIGRAIRRGDLVAVQKDDGVGGAGDRTAELRRLAREIARRSRGGLRHAGRTFTLVADVDLQRVPSRNGYEVVGRTDAEKVLDAVAAQAGETSELATLLGQARGNLTPDWRPPQSPDGLVLLRRLPVAQATTAGEEPALTPSQLQQLAHPKPDAWIKVHLLHAHTGEAIDGASLNLMLPEAKDPSSYETDKDGFVDVKDLPAGTFSIEGISDDDDLVWELVAHDQE